MELVELKLMAMTLAIVNITSSISISHHLQTTNHQE